LDCFQGFVQWVRTVKVRDKRAHAGIPLIFRLDGEPAIPGANAGNYPK
jgi:hypothetical protein